MLNCSFFDLTVVCILALLQQEDTTSHAWSRCGRFKHTLDYDAMLAVLEDLVPVDTALLVALQSNDGAQHDNKADLVVPDHLPKVGERRIGPLTLPF